MRFLARGAGYGLALTRTAAPSLSGRLPVAAQGLVSGVLGRDDPAYRVSVTPTGLALVNSRHGLAARFSRGGVVIRSGSARLRLALRAYGYGRPLREVAAATPRVRGTNGVAYRYGRLEEWYLNGPLGLEQGFRLAAPPKGRGVGLLTLALGLSGNMRGSLVPGGDAVTFSAGTGRPLFVYRGLLVTDARGRRLPARIELARGRLLLRVSDASAEYPLTIDPFVQQAILTPSDGERFNLFGDSVAVSGDVIVVGAPGATVGDQDSQGAVYVFVRPAGGWVSATEAARFTASDGIRNDNLGTSVAISGDTIVAGAPSIGGDDPGAVYVFVKPGGGWANGTETAKLTASDGSLGDVGRRWRSRATRSSPGRRSDVPATVAGRRLRVRQARRRLGERERRRPS